MKVMKRLSEKEIIRTFQQKKSISEDVEIFKLGNEICAANIDTLVESTDVPPNQILLILQEKVLSLV